MKVSKFLWIIVAAALALLGKTALSSSNGSEMSLEQMADYEVFKIAFEQTGSSQNKVASYDVDYWESPYSMTVTLYDVKITAEAEAMTKIKESGLVKSVYPIVTLDDSTVRLGIEFKRPVIYQVAVQNQPSQLTIEIAEDKAYQKMSVFQVHTDNMPSGEGLAMAEEMLTAKFSKMRVLPAKDSGLYYLELGQYQTEAEAQVAVKEAKALGLTVTYRKVN